MVKRHKGFTSKNSLRIVTTDIKQCYLDSQLLTRLIREMPDIPYPRGEADTQRRYCFTRLTSSVSRIFFLTGSDSTSCAISITPSTSKMRRLIIFCLQLSASLSLRQKSPPVGPMFWSGSIFLD